MLGGGCFYSVVVALSFLRRLGGLGWSSAVAAASDWADWGRGRGFPGRSVELLSFSFFFWEDRRFVYRIAARSA